MEKLQVKYDEEVIIKAQKDAIKNLPKKIIEEASSDLPKEGAGNKFAGFF